ncbi:MAG: PAS domain S-box protein [Candidatus Sedimenticola endophacoides]
MANGGALENLGLEGDDCGRFTLIELIDGIDRAGFERLVRPLREGEVAGLSLQVRHRRRDGTTYPVEARLQYSEREEPPVFVLTALDLTDREAAQE